MNLLINLTISILLGFVVGTIFIKAKRIEDRKTRTKVYLLSSLFLPALLVVLIYFALFIGLIDYILTKELLIFTT